ncbi:hypothetical protein Acsp04_60800 [Actinomadura sp. NBRC 104425]|uniref:hypothetical protein n=1 Tax=Actinomadura sp. NBRC 104425 TaxID=3032204 RepID=UPI0024A47D5E|nr:hypothetical protein [Actinomadura sp. NBRC 104425]GLZ15845.1 hypothetical protein Acsp04_60800 [Actinomadura sp. NBRC 104425]
MKPKRLSPETRAVIDAVREAVDVPAAAPHPGDQQRRGEILDARIRHLLRSLEALPGGRVDVQAHIASLRALLAAYPATGYSHACDTTGGVS